MSVHDATEKPGPACEGNRNPDSYKLHSHTFHGLVREWIRMDDGWRGIVVWTSRTDQPPPSLTVLKIRGLPTVLNEVSTLLYYIIYVLNKRAILNNREYLFSRVGQNIYAHISFL